MTQAMFRVLVVEDDADVRRVLAALLAADGHRVVEAESAARALVEVRSHQPDAVLLDLGLPDRDGQELIREIRRFSTVPILVISARTMEHEKIRALDSGADDYVTKPFSAGEVVARVRAALRRGVQAAGRPSHLVRIGGNVVDLASREARNPAGQALRLTPMEFRVLACLIRGNGLIVTRDQIMREVWGPDRMEDTRGLRAYIRLLRQKLEPDPQRPSYLLTEPGLGYRLHCAEEHVDQGAETGH